MFFSFIIMTNFKVKAKSLKVSWLKSAATSVLTLSAMAGALMATGTSVSAQVAPPFGSSVAGQNKNIFYFTPWGDQLDGDNTPNDLHVPDTDLSANPQVINHNIYDIEIGPKTPLDFDLYLYTTAPQYNVGANFLTSFEFLTKVDPTEYKFTRNNLASFAPNPALVNNCTVPDADINSVLTCNFVAPLALANNANFLNGVLLGTFQGITVNPGLAPDDGKSDFRLDLSFLRYSNNNDVAGVNGQFQDVEVQHVPGPLPILGAAAAFRFCRKARKLSARNKTLSMG
jgi:hypothetical protein